MTTPEILKHTQQALAKTYADAHKVDAETLAVPGFTKGRMRQLYNNLCSPPGWTYLEVGLWQGASFTAACCNNRELTAFGIESFQQPFHVEGVRPTLLQNLETVRSKTGRLTFIESDCWTADLNLVTQPVDLFLYDGDHAEQYQFRALPHFLDKMADSFLFAVDDWNWWFVSKGTMDSFKVLADRVRLVHRWTWRTHCPGGVYHDQWHNGLALFLFEKL